MNRKHTVEQYFEVFQKLKKINDGIKFSSDFIIGYPGETNNDFDETVNLIKEIKFINSYSFIFSPRPGTKAADYDLINPNVSKDRLITIQQMLSSYQLETNKLFNGTNIEVLIENRMNNQKKLFGRNKYLNSVIVEGSENLIGELANVTINHYNQNTLFGKTLNQDIKVA